MKRNQRLISAAVILSLLLICFAGCSSDQTTESTLAAVVTEQNTAVSAENSAGQTPATETGTNGSGTDQSASETGTSAAGQTEKQTGKTEQTETSKSEKPYEYDQEPASPVRKIDLSQAIKGIDGHEAVRFFKTISTMPLLYHYTTTHVQENHSREAIIALADQGRSYVHLIDGSQSVEIVSPERDKYYELNDKEKTATEISKQDAQGDIISQDSFEQLYAHANELYFVGEGEAKFKGMETKFEEYTKDNRTFIRYYFANEMVYGHRTFENDQLISEVVISTLKNYFEMDIFAIPQGYRTVAAQN